MKPSRLFMAAMIGCLCLALGQLGEELPSHSIAVAAAADGASEITITQPDGPVEARDLVQLWVTGLPAGKFDKCRVTVTPSKGTVMIPGTWGNRLFVVVSAKHPGEYKLEIIRAVAEDVLQDASATIVVEGENRPDPPQPPDPPDPPDPGPTTWQVMVFLEALEGDELTRDQHAFVNGLAFEEELEEAGHAYEGRFDRNSVMETRCDQYGRCVEVVQADKKPWWEAVEDEALPCMAIAPMDGGTIQVFPLPSDAEAVYKILEETRP